MEKKKKKKKAKKEEEMTEEDKKLQEEAREWQFKAQALHSFAASSSRSCVPLLLLRLAVFRAACRILKAGAWQWAFRLLWLHLCTAWGPHNRSLTSCRRRPVSGLLKRIAPAPLSMSPVFQEQRAAAFLIPLATTSTAPHPATLTSSGKAAGISVMSLASLRTCHPGSTFLPPAVKAAGISVMGGGSYEQEFAAEMARAKEGKAKATPWGSGYAKAPEILHGALL